MNDMYDRLKLGCERTDARFGVEIEVEGLNLPHNVKGWRYEKDGSLRAESAEYVFEKPLGAFNDLEPVNKAIDTLGKAFKKNESVIDEAVRAGVHVHMNIQDYTPLELLTFITTYYMLEDHLVAWCGKTRVGNHFCLRTSDAEYVINLLFKACETKDWRHLNTEDIRYTALNLTSMFKYGSVEFRSMRSTADLEQIKKFVAIVNQIAKAAKEYASPRSVIDAVSEHGGSERFIRATMGEYADEFLQFDKLTVWRGMENVQPIAQLIEWDKFNGRKINPFL